MCDAFIFLQSTDGTLDRGALLYADGARIHKMTISGKHYNDVVNTAKSIESIDVDIKTNVVYWTDLDEEPKIKRAMIPLKNTQLGISQDLELKDLNHPQGIAVDWVGR